jgi:hypothetical protein
VVTKPLNEPRRPYDEDLSDIPVAPPPEHDIVAQAPAHAPGEQAYPEWRVLFHLHGTQSSTVGLDVWRVTVLGRADPMSAFRPDLDYAPYGAMRYGVSRRHALLRPGERDLYIVDQNSTNGTWVNGQRLMPGRDFPLSDGDIIELGALRMTVRIVQSPGDDESAPKEKPKRRMRGWRFRFFKW